VLSFSSYCFSPSFRRGANWSERAVDSYQLLFSSKPFIRIAHPIADSEPIFCFLFVLRTPLLFLVEALRYLQAQPRRRSFRIAAELTRLSRSSPQYPAYGRCAACRRPSVCRWCFMFRERTEPAFGQSPLIALRAVFARVGAYSPLLSVFPPRCLPLGMSFDFRCLPPTPKLISIWSSVPFSPRRFPQKASLAQLQSPVTRR